jgi:hypothetical protein
LFILAGLIYLGISILVVFLAVRLARRQKIAGWKFGIPAGLTMYLLLFWDHAPTLVAHEYYCGKEAGFTVYKTLEQWKEENPGVAESLSYKRLSDSEVSGNTRIYHLNERFDWRISEKQILLSLLRTENQVVDVKTGEILARHVDFRTGWGNFAIGANELRDYKLWLVNKSCETKERMESAKQFSKFENSIKRAGE